MFRLRRGGTANQPILIEEIPAPQTGEDGAVVTIGDFMDNFFAETRSWNGRPTISGVRTTSTAAYRGVAAHSPEDRVIGTRSDGQPEEDMPVYEITLQNADGTKGFALVVELEQYLQDVIAFVPVGAIADTTFNKALAGWFADTHAVRPQGGMMQEGWESDFEGYVSDTEEFVRPMTQSEINTYGFRYSYWGHVNWGKAYGPLLRTEWDQIPPYNNGIRDTTSTGQRYTAGCGPVALAQVLAYHKYPNWSWIDWNLVTSKPRLTTSSADAQALEQVAELLRVVGIDTKTNYVSDSGNASGYFSELASALMKYGYNVISSLIYNNANTKWAVIYNNILSARPVLISGDAGGSTGHSWVIDGAYDFTRWYYYGSLISEHTETGSTRRYELWRVQVQGRPLLHCNWGWGGRSNGWFYSYDPPRDSGGTLNFNSHILTSVDIYPIK